LINKKHTDALLVILSIKQAIGKTKLSLFKCNMNLNTDFISTKIELDPDYEGEVIATLISSKLNKGDRKSVLYVHGYVDYFFHPHLCEEFHKNQFDFYALDLRKCGRSLLAHQKPNYCEDIEEYFEEITKSIDRIKENGSKSIYLLGHSTGGLTTSCYMNKGDRKEDIAALVLNSPFLDMAENNLCSQFRSYSFHILHIQYNIRLHDFRYIFFCFQGLSRMKQ